MQALRDPSILGPIAALSSDFTAVEWAERLQVSLDEVLLAFDILCLSPRKEPPLPPTHFKKLDQATAILEAMRMGNHRLADIAREAGMHYSIANQKILLLEKHGVVQRFGKGPKTRWVVT
jgi:predicted transcriptional regulator